MTQSAPCWLKELRSASVPLLGELSLKCCPLTCTRCTCSWAWEWSSQPRVSSQHRWKTTKEAVPSTPQCRISQTRCKRNPQTWWWTRKWKTSWWCCLSESCCSSVFRFLSASSPMDDRRSSRRRLLRWHGRGLVPVPTMSARRIFRPVLPIRSKSRNTTAYGSDRQILLHWAIGSSKRLKP